MGDGERWREIAALNEGHTMVDGTVFRANSFLQPGWQLQMPDTPTGAGDLRTQLDEAAPAGGEKSEHVVTVHSGDYLSKIAEEELGDGNEWPELFKASQGQEQPHGLPKITDPDVIYAGQQVTVPGTQPDQPTPPHGSNDGDAAGSQDTTPPEAKTPGANSRRAMTRGMRQLRAPARRPLQRRRLPAQRAAAWPSSPGRPRARPPPLLLPRRSPAATPPLPRRRRPGRPVPLPPPPPPRHPRRRRRPRPTVR
ncbi:LysM peptidoglycan-binding domain-containing protein [Streptomyces sp. TLI_185]|uniref:LysM peptidoglycan-binding domain-containing protein n=1 Tax=Streptomyces sp. TLI_185 TaxID=2485151 RepID=UPI0021A2D43C|nr:LysM peptidoglycan-binding domain-containing protein [Streptomyces sp. TLI_185]